MSMTSVRAPGCISMNLNHSQMPMPLKPAKSSVPANKSAGIQPPSKNAAKPSVSKAKRTPAASSTAEIRTRQLGGDLAPARIEAILMGLDEAYPSPVCALNHRSPWELLVATILSAQCTDARVNIVTPTLFKRFPTPAAMAQAELPELEELIRTTGFFRNKAKSIKGAAERITTVFKGKVPQTLEELITVPGAARKTANVVLGVSFNRAEGVVVDTHVFRVTHRLDLTHSDTAEKVEQDLMRILPQERWINFSHQVIYHGRQVCIARKPQCQNCNLEQLCHSEDKTWKS